MSLDAASVHECVKHASPLIISCDASHLLCKQCTMGPGLAHTHCMLTGQSQEA